MTKRVIVSKDVYIRLKRFGSTYKSRVSELLRITQDTVLEHPVIGKAIRDPKAIYIYPADKEALYALENQLKSGSLSNVLESILNTGPVTDYTPPDTPATAAIRIRIDDREFLHDLAKTKNTTLNGAVSTLINFWSKYHDHD